jgi:pyruvate dehydrogenase E1 component alpha subunit
MNKQDLIAFEKEIERIYSAGKIRAPIHLSGGNEESLIEIFKDIKEEDWIFSSYRNHYQALLKGLDPEILKKKIIDGHSMHIMDKKNKIFSTSIVGGQLPIAVGVALALKRKNSKNKVYAFCGDMASEMGVFNESLKYAQGHELPITFIIEDNKLGVCTNTREVWGIKSGHNLEELSTSSYVQRYEYTPTYPHHGVGLWVNFPEGKELDKDYKKEITNAMTLLGQDSRTIFLGQTVGVKGSPIYQTLENVSLEKRIETPIMEEVQMGISTGLALEGEIPISIFPRFDFLILATNQLVNHLDKISQLSEGEFNPKVIIRTLVGSKKPLNPGVQHSGNYTSAYRKMLTNTEVIELKSSEEIFPAYEHAISSSKPSLIIEHMDRYS